MFSNNNLSLFPEMSKIRDFPGMEGPKLQLYIWSLCDVTQSALSHQLAVVPFQGSRGWKQRAKCAALRILWDSVAN